MSLYGNGHLDCLNYSDYLDYLSKNMRGETSGDQPGNKEDRFGEGGSGVKEVRNGKDQPEMTTQVSFRDKVVGNTSSNALRNVDSFDIDKLTNVKNGSGDSDVPSI
ncbi:hypothetical protein PIB30_052298 [Stylosanthes scabra]|uniref:Uncharacterized protein n=1 Tax=Stylosanthes scabra TaxID=79078 RepID=A0ABU6SI95_9FABA|nr:hypothetical protein [Stylosanthes scabra]